MKKYSLIILSLILFLGVYVPTSHAASANTINCDQYKNVKKVMWNGMELKAGQMGLLTVLKDTSLYKLNGQQKVYSRTLKKNDVYNIYTFKEGMLGLGGGYYVNRDTNVKYETPSKEKLEAAKCVNSTDGSNSNSTSSISKMNVLAYDEYDLDVHWSASQTSKVLYKIPAFQSFVVTGKFTNWFQVKSVKNKTGWVYIDKTLYWTDSVPKTSIIPVKNGQSIWSYLHDNYSCNYIDEDTQSGAFMHDFAPLSGQNLNWYKWTPAFPPLMEGKGDTYYGKNVETSISINSYQEHFAFYDFLPIALKASIYFYFPESYQKLYTYIWNVQSTTPTRELYYDNRYVKVVVEHAQISTYQVLVLIGKKGAGKI